jgi:uncharacterized protein (TIGR02145 family)
MKKLISLSALFIFAVSYGQGEQLYANGTATDQDGNSFEWINYGTQDWAIDNAEVVTYRDGTPIPQVTSTGVWTDTTTGAWCYYDNDPTKGKLYNWYAVMGIHDTDPNTPNKEFAPEGWHVPTDAEWTTLETYLIANGYNYDGTTTGNKIAKAMASTSGWFSSTQMGAVGNEQSSNNNSGFNAFPEGNRNYDGSFNVEGNNAIFWTSTGNVADYALFRLLTVSLSNSRSSSNDNLQPGFSVRYVRNTSSVGANGDILLNGTISAENNQIKNVADPTDAQDAVNLAYITQLETSIQGLEDNNESLQTQIDELRNLLNQADFDLDGFTPLNGDCDDTNASINPNIYEVADGIDNDCDGLIDEGYEALSYPEDVDGNTYDFAIYGNQHWTVENAKMVTYRDGTPIPQVTDEAGWSNLTTGAWCYYDNDPTKGKLYNWYAVMGIHDTDPNTPNKEFAPVGWHVPSDFEWTTLENYLIANGYDSGGNPTGNKIAKAMASTSGWVSSIISNTPSKDQSLNNSSGFNAFPEGFRNSYNEGLFYEEGNYGVFWSSTESSDFVWVRYLVGGGTSVSRVEGFKEDGFSVRFVRD